MKRNKPREAEAEGLKGKGDSKGTRLNNFRGSSHAPGLRGIEKRCGLPFATLIVTTNGLFAQPGFVEVSPSDFLTR